MKTKVYATNRKANFNYEIFEKYHAGISLYGNEVKSIILGNVNINDAFVIEKHNELFIINMDISPYRYSTNIKNINQKRKRKLLLTKNEILKIKYLIKKNKYVIIPINIYRNRKYIKIDIALAKYKKKYDKRESIKKRDEAKINRY